MEENMNVVDEPQTDTRSFEDMYEYGRLGDSVDDSIEESVDEVADEVETEKIIEEDNGGNAVEDSSSKDFKNEQNAYYAAQRRKQEEDKRIADAVEKAQNELIKEVFSGQNNPYTNESVNTIADYRAYQKMLHEETIRNAGLTQEQFDAMVEQSPQVQKANEVLAQQEAYRKQQDLEHGQQLLNNDVLAISKLDPTIKTLDDIIKDEKFGEIQDKIAHGYTLLDAYKVVNLDKITQHKSAVTKQRVINQTNNRQHLTSTQQSGTGNDISVPADVRALYREMMPGITDKQIREHYTKRLKG